MGEYRESVFNVKVNHNGNYIYNTKTSALAKFDKSIEECLSDNKLRDQMMEYGFVVKSDENEVYEYIKFVNSSINKTQDTLEVTIVLTESCNFRCLYCYQDKATKVFSEDDANKFLVEIEKLLKDGLQNLKVHYFGGEPLLNYDIIKKIEFSLRQLIEAYNCNYSNYITTNGSLLKKDILAEDIFDTIQLTFDGYKKMHEKYKKNKNFGYIDLLGCVNEVMKYSTSKVKIRFNICEENSKYFNMVIDDIFNIENFDVDRISFAFNPMRNHKNIEEFKELSPEEYSKIDLMLRKYLLSKGKKLYLPNAASQPCKFTCGNAICVGPDLRTYFCSSNFNEKGITELPSFMRKNKFNFTLPSKCQKCNVMPICLCGCKMLDVNKNACISEKYIIDEMIKLYLDNPDKVGAMA